ncbi:Putative leucine-rich repeat receptor-like serine/threonine-protein kinase At2g19230 [Rhizoctonia solani]|uniref:Putative leucine-rich repeat receptor-like serine/threonine-protein kinase At2g19230 n=1 Tax=Rhizoctonia solani TaxID=456999 RepID=A0A0K6GAU9_9AGAM|nr:Putative leucine-rich repeat receptor-like serine/threonine-protein kinase At2g19230 [Rhizoctonia solani]
MSKIYTSPLLSGALGVTKDITKFVQVSRVSEDLYEEAGLGGSADIFSGEYMKQDGGVTRVAIKCIRAFNLEQNAEEQPERLQKKLLRELKIWRTLSGGANIIELLGIMNGIGPFPSFVCELCPWNLQDYLERKTPPPRHTKMMADTLRGLSYMHSLESGPVAHGDMKLTNILVTSDEHALICDFGRSRQPTDQPYEVILSNSSPFAGTVRYMSPELFVPNSARPSPAADMWAYGCIALEILCRIQPYHETTSDIVVAELIRSGEPPSTRPHGPRGSLINDTLWRVLSSCWSAQDWRPTAHGFLEELTEMLHNGEVPNSPILMDMFPRVGSEPIPPWPREIEDMDGQLRSLALRSRGLRSTIFSASLGSSQVVAVKVPRLNASLDNQVRHDHLEYIFRKVVINRFGVRHPNIIEFLGITSGFSPHEGLVFELCFQWTLDKYLMKKPVMPERYTRSADPYPTHYSLMCDILEGLKFMHGYPIPIAHGDLIPENISVDNDGRAKISLFSFGRMLAALPLDAGVTATVESVLSFRWMSPELITTNNPQPTTESDMWTFGCICFWLLTLLPPYASTSRDDLAGMEIMQGHPPATLARVVIKAGYDFESTPMARDALHSNLPSEIAIMAQIDHPRIHKLLGIDSSIEPKQLPRMVFEPLSQATLEFVLNQNDMDFESRMRTLQDTASAVTYLHEHSNGSISHGNICPTNIYIFPDGSAKLTNFTCAFQYIISADPSSPRQWSEAIAMAEPSLYRSPESRTVPGSELELVFPTLAGDVWSFGVVMLSSFSALFRIVDLEKYSLALDAGDSPLDLEGVGEECDLRVRAMLRSILALDPSRRPPISAILSEVASLA